MTIEVETGSPDQTEELASRIGEHLDGGEVILLTGSLGAGKTCFVRGLARGLGVDPRQVKSPSYNILHQYDGGRRTLQHFDAYFVREAEEFRRAGLDDFLDDGDVVVIEWADRFPGEFGDDALRVRIELPPGATEEEMRRLSIEGGRGTPWLAEISSGAGS